MTRPRRRTNQRWVTVAPNFGTGTALRQHFHAALGVSPRAYRRTFRGAASGSSASSGPVGL
ncbi:hypothetical protein [Streptomyces atroolivaceus]|uniref:hypothetical protein n=1 Tax=Streptomyces atroolivaceus TaxID=66869 RepID=UPI003F4DAB73